MCFVPIQPVACTIDILQLWFNIIIKDLQCGLYYIHVTSVKDASSNVVLALVFTILKVHCKLKRTIYYCTIVNYASMGVAMFVVVQTQPDISWSHFEIFKIISILKNGPFRDILNPLKK